LIDSELKIEICLFFDFCYLCFQFHRVLLLALNTPELSLFLEKILVVRSLKIIENFDLE